MFSRTSIVLPFALGLVALGTTPALAQEARARDVARIIELGRTDSQVQDHLWHLSKEIGPRLTSSSNLDTAYEWTRSQFESFGLEARIEKYDEWAVGFDRGPFSGRMISGEPDDVTELTFITRSWAEGTDGLTRGGVALVPKTMEELEALRDRIGSVWLLRPTEPRAPRSRRGSDDNSEPDGLRRALADLLEETPPLGQVRRARSDLLVTGGNPPASIEERTRGVNITMLPADFEAITAQFAENPALELEFDIKNEFREGPIALCNVVADIKGTEFPDEYVIVQGHLDSWDGAEGTCDNGTGTSTTLEAARLLAKAGVKPRRTIRFVLYSGEEQGLYGSNAYVKDHADELEKISIVLNHDNGTNYLKGIDATQPMMADFQDAFSEIMELDPERPFTISPVQGIGPGPSDHAPFVRAGVPGFHWNQDGDGYRFIHHTQNDLFKHAKPEDQKHSALVAAISAYNFANLDHLVDRTDMKAPENRKMGVTLDGNSVQRVFEGGKASEAGWKNGDVIISIDGEETKSQRDVVSTLQAGAARKTVKLKRGDEVVETVLDYTDDPEEATRRRHRDRKEKREKEAQEAKRKAREGEK